jgi:hypothetical protein
MGTLNPETEADLMAAALARLEDINMELLQYDALRFDGHYVRDERYQQLLTEHDQIANHLLAEVPCDGVNCYVCDADAAWEGRSSW